MRWRTPLGVWFYLKEWIFLLLPFLYSQTAEAERMCRHNEHGSTGLSQITVGMLFQHPQWPDFRSDGGVSVFIYWSTGQSVSRVSRLDLYIRVDGMKRRALFSDICISTVPTVNTRAELRFVSESSSCQTRPSTLRLLALSLESPLFPCPCTLD